jgi:hypothetical protein
MQNFSAFSLQYIGTRLDGFEQLVFDLKGGGMVG